MKWFRRRHRPAPVSPPEWTDPLNPHGDGTLRPGDPVFDAITRGHAVIGNFGPEGWEFHEEEDQ